MTQSVREQVFEALDNAHEGGYADFVTDTPIAQLYVDLCDCSEGIIHLPVQEVKKAIEDWRANKIEAAWTRQQEADMESPPKTLLEQQREAQKLK